MMLKKRSHAGMVLQFFLFINDNAASGIRQKAQKKGTACTAKQKTNQLPSGKRFGWNHVDQQKKRIEPDGNRNVLERAAGKKFK